MIGFGDGTEIHIENHPWEATVGVYVIRRVDGGKKAMFLDRDCAWQNIDEAVEIAAPTFRIEKSAAVALCGQLHRDGLVPDDQADRRGEIAALKEHLGDMRKIVSKTIDVNLDRR